MSGVIDKALTWFPWYSSKWLSSSTRFDMSLAERAIYLDLLFFAYERNGRIPNDPSKLAKWTLATPDEFASAWLVIGKHFVVCEDDPTMLTNLVVQDTIGRHWKAREAKSTAGRLGGLASGSSRKRSRNEAADQADAEAEGQAETKQRGKQIEREKKENKKYIKDKGICSSPDGNERVETSLFPDSEEGNATEPTSKRLGEKLLLATQQDEWFGQWWDIYWRKVARGAARKAFGRHVRTPERFEAVMNATRSQMAEMMARDVSMRPHGASWLHAERWDDESAPAKRDSAAEAIERVYRRKLKEQESAAQ